MVRYMSVTRYLLNSIILSSVPNKYTQKLSINKFQKFSPSISTESIDPPQTICTIIPIAIHHGHRVTGAETFTHPIMDPISRPPTMGTELFARISSRVFRHGDSLVLPTISRF